VGSHVALLTGGAAWTDVTFGAVFLPFGVLPGTIASDRQAISGATVGGGLEYAITNNLSLGIEGRYTWYDTHNFNMGVLATAGVTPTALTVAPTTGSLKFNTAEVMRKLNWRGAASQEACLPVKR